MLKQYKSIIKRIAISLSFLFVFGRTGFSQITIAGPTCVESGVNYSYYLIGDYSWDDYFTWSINGGVSAYGNTSESGTGLVYLPIRFTSSSGYITVYYNGSTYNLNVSVTSALSAGSITSNGSQTINYNYTPSTINCSGASGGYCSPSYSYQWQSSTDGTNWSNMSGKTSQNLSFSSGLTQTSYFRRKVTETSSSSVGYSNTATVYVNPPLTPGNVYPSSQNIFAGDNASSIGGSPAYGGSCGSGHVHQWEYSTNGTNFYEINGENGYGYSPGAVSTTTYYRRKVTCNGDVAYTPAVVVNVYQHLTAGVINPSTYNTAYNTSPGQLTATAATGGICGSYSYQWRKSIGDGNWTDISGATSQNYTPPALTATTYYQRRVSCGSDTLYTDVAVVILPLTSGTVSGGSSPILTGTAPGQLSMSASSGGNCYNSPTYLWQKSTDGVNFSATNAAGPSYTPGPLNTTTYFRCMTVCGTAIVYSNVRTITVFPHINPGAILTSSFDVVYNTVPSSIVTTAASGTGNCSSITYQWQRSTDGANFTDISGATSQNYSFTEGQTQRYFYRRKATCDIDVMYTDAIAVGIICPAGSISCSQLIQPAGTPSGFVLSNSGGIPGASMSYQWESSTDEISWSAISGATSTSYTPSSPSATTYYRVKVGCGNTLTYANTVRIKVKGAAANNIPNSSTASSTETAIAMPSYPSGTDANNQNYVRSRTFAKPGITDLTTANAQTGNGDVAQVTEYVDGLGRSIQSVAKGTTPAGSDMIATTWYDQYGRVGQKYLPYTDNSSSGGFRTDPNTQQPSFYNSYFNNTEGFYYSNSIIENSPLNKVLKETAPGKSWTGSAKGARVDQRTNRVEEDVKIWSVGTSIGAVPGVTGVYNKGQLFVAETTDESENKVIEYKDKEGKVILKKVLSSDTYCETYNGWLSTYYIYDDFGRLRWVLQPKAVEWLLSNSWSLSSSTTVQDELCFRYEYDAKGRMIIKKVPGAGEVWMVYDERDRIVMTQDANLRAQSTKQWLVTKYDDLNRPTGTGLLNDVNNRSYHEGQAAVGTIPYPSTASGYDILTETFYNDYTYAGAKGYDNSINSNLNAGNNPYPETVVNSSLTKGMVTGTRTKVLGTSTYLITTIYYDNKGRVVQTRADNYSGGEDIIVNQYDFSGKVLSSFTKHQKPSATTIEVLTKMSYDHAGRLLTIKKSVNGSADKLTVQNSYDELGQLKKKELGKKADNSFLETLDYTYNIRGWLNSVNKDFATNTGTNANNRYFGMELSYDYGFTQNQLNGNIGGMKWRSKGDGEQRAYGFDYDNVSRLLKADFNQNNSGWNVNAGIDFSVSNLSYDPNGNIANMTQKAWKLAGSSIIDQLTYGYVSNSNRLNAVTDPTYNDFSSKLGDFKYDPSTKGSTDYSYDVNGNMVSDANKKISSIAYNYLNLPGTITITGKGSIDYTYDAVGNKLKKVVHETGQPDKTTLYLFGTYENDVLQFLPQEEGRIRPLRDGSGNITSFAYDYLLKDHLGNVRTVLTDEQKTDAYPAATMETASATAEEAIYSKVAETRTDKPNGYPYDSYLDPHAKVSKVRGDGQKIGPGIVLKVMAGDRFNLRVSSYWKSNGVSPDQNPANPLTDLISVLSGNIAPLAAGKASASELSGSSSFSTQAQSFLNNRSYTSTKPKAYVQWVLFDEQFKYVGSSSSFEQVGNDGDLTPHTRTDLPVDKNGYLYVYVSNETTNLDVFFDNLSVTHIHGPILEETHYYPFGLTMAGISSKAANITENKKKYNGIELENDLEIQTYDAFFRELDPQTGRWWQIDPVTDGYESISPYASMYDNPMKYSDPLGNEGESCCLTGVLTWIFNIGGSPEQRMENVKSNINGISNAVSGALNQMGENAKARWDAGADPFHQAVANPLSLLGGPVAAIEGNALKATLGTAAKQEVQVLKAVEKYEVGSAKDLSKISVKDNLDIHHVSQSKPASQLIKGYDKATAPAIALPKAEHKAIPTLKGTNTAGNARQQLAKDIKDLRRFTNAPNSSLQKVIDLNKKMYPESFKK
jgi:RHS repeat-associated protein